MRNVKRADNIRNTKGKQKKVVTFFLTSSQYLQAYRNSWKEEKMEEKKQNEEDK
jgi:hypothetical protein